MNFEFKTPAPAGNQRRIHYTILVDRVVEHCNQCPARGSHRGHGEAWDECRHPKNPGPYNNIIMDDGNPFPSWCPA
jgi:hypothetical protein